MWSMPIYLTSQNYSDMKYIFDRSVSLIGLLFLWPVLLVVAILIKVKMPDDPVIFKQKRVGCLPFTNFAL